MPDECFPSGTYDVAIAGAGPAGAALALGLARRGARVALFDAAAFPRDKLCGEYLSPESWSVLDRMGVADALAHSGYQPIRRVRITTPRGRVVEAEVAGLDSPPGIGLSRSVLDAILARGARAAGAAVFEQARARGPVVSERRVVGLAVQHPTWGTRAVHARVTIAATGRSSTLVRQTGRIAVRNRFCIGTGTGTQTRHFGLKRHLGIALPGGDPPALEPPDVVGLHLVPGGYGGTCRIEGGMTNFCALLPEAAVRQHRGNLDRVVHRYLGRNPTLARLTEALLSNSVGAWKTVAGVRVAVATPRLPGIFYAGDCQGTVDPLGGQGMTMALLGAELLAPFVEQALICGPDALSRLQRTAQAAWHHRFDGRVRLCRLLHHVLVHPILIDATAALGPLAPRLLNACYRQTRDHDTAPGA